MYNKLDVIVLIKEQLREEGKKLNEYEKVRGVECKSQA